APHRRDAGLDDLARLELGLGKAKAKLVPDPRLGPGVHRVVGVDLEIEPADLGRPHAVQGEAAVMVGVDELVGGRRCLREDAQPGKGIRALVGFVFEPGAGDAVRAVATGHELALQLRRLAVASIGDTWAVILDTLDGGRLSLEPDLTTVRQALLDQVLDHLLLAIDRDPPAGQLAEVDAVLLAGEAQFDAVVDETLADHALAHSARFEEIGRSLFEDAGSDPALDVVSAAPLQDDGCNALPAQEVREHEPGRTRADDADHPTLQNVSNARLAPK